MLENLTSHHACHMHSCIASCIALHVLACVVCLLACDVSCQNRQPLVSRSSWRAAHRRPVHPHRFLIRQKPPRSRIAPRTRYGIAPRSLSTSVGARLSSLSALPSRNRNARHCAARHHAHAHTHKHITRRRHKTNTAPWDRSGARKSLQHPKAVLVSSDGANTQTRPLADAAHKT